MPRGAMEDERMMNPCHILVALRWVRHSWLPLALVCALGLTVEPAVGQEPKPAAKPSEIAAIKRPVILLTGFEPFGEHRDPNPSWEGIKELDGKEWNGYQLVCKQAKVVWGSPLEQLEGWISQYQPVAVFSFGEGRPSIFSLETRARNARGDHKDNDGEKPKNPTIVDQGPGKFEATVESVKLVDELVDKGYPLYISRNAGKYLCEEALYSLEFIKATKKLSANVLFCHVPTLGSRISREKKVTPAYVRQFVMDMLETWDKVCPKPALKTTAHEPAINAPDTRTPRVLRVSMQQAAPAKEGAQKVDDPRLPNVKKFVEHYFSSWSEQDMDGYDACFLPEACIQFIDPRGLIQTSGKARFVASQRAFHRSSTIRTIEVPETIDIRFEGRLARAVVYWKLTSGDRIERGYDHFTLMIEEGQWRIVNLVFYGTSSGR
jgi:pyroglutamyl-peptidase